MAVVEVGGGACAALFNVYAVRVALPEAVNGGQVVSLAPRPMLGHASASCDPAVSHRLAGGQCRLDMDWSLGASPCLARQCLFRVCQAEREGLGHVPPFILKTTLYAYTRECDSLDLYSKKTIY